MTVRELIARALRRIGVLASGESLGAAEASEALSIFNDLLDSWQTERLTISTQDRVTLAIVSGRAVYTIGSGGHFNRAFPLWIDRAGLLTADGEETPLGGPLTTNERAAIGLKTQTADHPAAIFYNPEFPLGEIEVYPIATDTSASLVLYLPGEPLSSGGATLDTVLSLRPGWARALRYNLAQELLSEYGRPADPLIYDVARESKANIKRPNLRINDLVVDRALRRPISVSSSNFNRGDL
jgi:hypothetical protein